MLKAVTTMRQPRDAPGFEITLPSVRRALDQGVNNPWQFPVQGPKDWQKLPGDTVGTLGRAVPKTHSLLN